MIEFIIGEDMKMFSEKTHSKEEKEKSIRFLKAVFAELSCNPLVNDELKKKIFIGGLLYTGLTKDEVNHEERIGLIDV